MKIQNRFINNTLSKIKVGDIFSVDYLSYDGGNYAGNIVLIKIELSISENNGLLYHFKKVDDEDRFSWTWNQVGLLRTLYGSINHISVACKITPLNKNIINYKDLEERMLKIL